MEDIKGSLPPHAMPAAVNTMMRQIGRHAIRSRRRRTRKSWFATSLLRSTLTATCSYRLRSSLPRCLAGKARMSS